MRRSTASLATLFGCAGLCVSALAGVWFVRQAAPDAILAHDFRGALAGTNLSWSARSPNVWLSSLDGAPRPLGKSLTLGDTITIAGRGGRPDAVEVTSLEQVDGGRFGLPGVQFQLVTAHPLGRLDGTATAHAAGAPVRFLFSVEQPEAAVSTRPAGRAL